MKFIMYARKKGEKEWRKAAKSERDTILYTLNLNMESPQLRGYEYKIEPVEE